MTPPENMHQQGFSLVELMIAVTLSLVLVGGATQLMLSTNQTVKVTDDLARTQENGRFALNMLTKDIRMAGYRGAQGGDLPPYFYTGTCGDALPCTTNGLAASPGGSDRIAIAYDPPPDDGTAEFDCIGDAIDTGNIIANVYWIEADGNNINRLMCRGFDVDDNVWVNPAGTSQPLIEGVDSLQLLYGISADGSTSSATRYVAADNLLPGDWANIQAVRIAVLVSTGDTSGNALEKTRTYILLDNPGFSFTDTSSRYIYNTTVKVNNAG